MSRFGVMAALFAMIGVTDSVSAQQTTTQQTLAASLQVYVFPEAGQAADQQSKDEAECYQWAVGNTGADPFDVEKQAAAAQQQAEQQKQQAAQSAKGAGAKGALGGAAAGALIGEIASDDAGEGAAYGAAAGAVVSRRRAKSASKEAQAQIEQQSAQSSAASATQIENFKKAFSVCLEGKKYLVKY